MSTENLPPDDDITVTVEVQKSEIARLLDGQTETSLDGEFLWPVPVRGLANLYRASAEHSRAIHVKAEGAFGGGLIGATERIDELCDTGSSELFVLLGLDLETYGNAFMQKIRSSDGKRVIGWRRLPAITMSRYRAGFLQRAARPDGTVRRITFTADEIVHLREPCPMGRSYALPSWIGAEGMLELAHAATAYNARFFANNAMPEYAITFKGKSPTKEQKDQIRQFFRNEFQGIDNSHRTLVLTTNEESSIEIKRLTAEVKDGDFLKLIDAARDRVPVAHGTMPRILGIMSAGQLGGGGEVTGQLFMFERLTLKPRRRRMLDQLRPVLREIGLKPGNVEDGLGNDQVAFRPLDLTPPSDDAEDLPALVQAGIVDRDEARALMPALAALRTDGGGAPIERSASDAGQLAALAAILAKV